MHERRRRGTAGPRLRSGVHAALRAGIPRPVETLLSWRLQRDAGCLAGTASHAGATSAGCRSPDYGYFSAAEEASILDEIERLNPDFIWVGRETPKQQDWIHRYKSRLKRGVIFAVGFAFDVNAVTKKDAPAWMQRFGLTWLFRIVSEPRRLLGRYLKYNTLFLFYLARDTIFARQK